MFANESQFNPQCIQIFEKCCPKMPYESYNGGSNMRVRRYIKRVVAYLYSANASNDNLSSQCSPHPHGMELIAVILGLDVFAVLNSPGALLRLPSLLRLSTGAVGTARFALPCGTEHSFCPSSPRSPTFIRVGNRGGLMVLGEMVPEEGISPVESGRAASILLLRPQFLF